jgi:hypothetical protein
LCTIRPINGTTDARVHAALAFLAKIARLKAAGLLYSAEMQYGGVAERLKAPVLKTGSG